ncbi:MAG: hypothetical protein HQ465_02900 [Rhodospirillales bacterium]|nr:hypothetical protein [Rhodospirillales bacterium]
MIPAAPGAGPRGNLLVHTYSRLDPKKGIEARISVPRDGGGAIVDWGDGTPVTDVKRDGEADRRAGLRSSLLLGTGLAPAARDRVVGAAWKPGRSSRRNWSTVKAIHSRIAGRLSHDTPKATKLANSVTTSRNHKRTAPA